MGFSASLTCISYGGLNDISCYVRVHKQWLQDAAGSTSLTMLIEKK